MSNLISCLRKAGDFLSADNRAAILEGAVGKRGQDRIDAAVAAARADACIALNR